MRKSQWLRLTAAAFSILFTAAFDLRAQAPNVYAIVGGTVHPVSSNPIENGTVVVRNGLIEAIGAGVRIPADAVVIDAAGAHVYPALFNAQSAVGIAPPERGRSSTPPADPGAAALTVQALRLDADALDSWRAAGVGTLLSAQRTGNFQGGSVIFNLGAGEPASLVLRSPAAIQYAFNTRSWGTFPDSLMGAIYLARQSLHDAAWQRAAREAYDRNPLGKQRPELSVDLEALERVLRREIPLVFLADDEVRIRAAAEIGREHDIRWIVSGAAEAWELGDLLAKTQAPVLVSVDWPKKPVIAAEDQSLRQVRDRVLAPTGPAELAKRRVPFALVSGPDLGAKGYIEGIRKAVEAGLPEADALRAVTLTPAQIFGVDRQIGSLERGKVANLLVTDGKFWERDAKVRELLVDGRRMRVRQPSDESEADADTASPASGSWSVTVRLPEGEVSLRFDLVAQGGRLTGSYSGDRGAGTIREGVVEGSAVRFSITAQTAPSGETDEWRFEGTIEGSSMEGKVDNSLGTFAFSGRKPE